MSEPKHRPQFNRNTALWTRSVFPLISSLIKTGYFSLRVTGLENVPSGERLIYVANHSSWLAFDGLLVPYALHQKLAERDLPYGIVHDVLFQLPIVGRFINHCGAIPASWVRDPTRIPKSVGSMGIFPEGDEGNSKPFWEAYRMRRWKKGFAKLAIDRRARVLPIAIQGLEESMPVAFTLKFFKEVFGTFAGYPLFPIPLPSQFKITFCEPVDLSQYPRTTQNNPEALDEIAENVRHIVQTRLDQEAVNRPLAKLSRLVSHLKS